MDSAILERPTRILDRSWQPVGEYQPHSPLVSEFELPLTTDHGVGLARRLERLRQYGNFTMVA